MHWPIVVTRLGLPIGVTLIALIGNLACRDVTAALGPWGQPLFHIALGAFLGLEYFHWYIRHQIDITIWLIRGTRLMKLMVIWAGFGGMVRCRYELQVDEHEYAVDLPPLLSTPKLYVMRTCVRTKQ